jgi:hypothetical protein
VDGCFRLIPDINLYLRDCAALKKINLAWGIAKRSGAIAVVEVHTSPIADSRFTLMAEGVQRVRVPGVHRISSVRDGREAARVAHPGDAFRRGGQYGAEGDGRLMVLGAGLSTAAGGAALATNRPTAAVGRPCSTPGAGRAELSSGEGRR